MIIIDAFIAYLGAYQFCSNRHYSFIYPCPLVCARKSLKNEETKEYWNETCMYGVRLCCYWQNDDGAHFCIGRGMDDRTINFLLRKKKPLSAAYAEHSKNTDEK